ncbi:cytochrome b5 [Musa acuminata AAA Group]|uniref:cytochrome b5 n=1 Tax=Musa acuminata AAA Group TaxID=214697 RepID=UPI0031CF20D4
MADSKIYHFDEVAKHKGAKDCWLIISGKVYDVTQFMDEHPGGDDVLLTASGKDATNDFEDIGHSNAAREMMDKYYIGKIDASTLPTKDTYVQKQQVIHKPDNSPEFVIKILQFLLPVMILGLAFAVRYLTKVD